MQIEQTGEYEEPALQWLFCEAQRLDTTLTRAGITDEAKRHEIAKNYFFDLTVALDQEGVAAAGEVFQTIIAFRSGDRLLLPDEETFSFHEYALSLVGEVYGL